MATATTWKRWKEVEENENYNDVAIGKSIEVHTSSIFKHDVNQTEHLWHEEKSNTSSQNYDVICKKENGVGKTDLYWRS